MRYGCEARPGVAENRQSETPFDPLLVKVDSCSWPELVDCQHKRAAVSSACATDVSGISAGRAY
jgi:hypothetical protein